MKRICSIIIFRLMGWKIVGSHTYPDKCLVVSAPHTSNWDFLIGRCYAYIIGVQPKYLIKSELFLPIIGTLLKWNGGVSVDRKAKNNVIEQVVEMFESMPQLHLGIAPEGTRKKVVKWKSGFYHIATKAKVPILLLTMDYENKKVGIINQIIPTGNFEKDMFFIQEAYKNIKGKVAENYNQNIF